MQSKRKILVPVDGSQFCTRIFPHLQNLFPPSENDIILLRVAHDPEGYVGKPSRPATAEMGVPIYNTHEDFKRGKHPIFASQARESAVADLTLDMLDEQHLLETLGYDVHVEIRLDHGRGQAIVQYINTHNIDAVAMTTHWRTGINKLIFGSVAQYVAQHVDIPVIMVRPE